MGGVTFVYFVYLSRLARHVSSRDASPSSRQVGPARMSMRIFDSSDLPEGKFPSSSQCHRVDFASLYCLRMFQASLTIKHVQVRVQSIITQFPSARRPWRPLLAWPTPDLQKGVLPGQATASSHLSFPFSDVLWRLFVEHNKPLYVYHFATNMTFLVEVAFTFTSLLDVLLSSTANLLC